MYASNYLSTYYNTALLKENKACIVQLPSYFSWFNINQDVREKQKLCRTNHAFTGKKKSRNWLFQGESCYTNIARFYFWSWGMAKDKHHLLLKLPCQIPSYHFSKEKKPSYQNDRLAKFGVTNINWNLIIYIPGSWWVSKLKKQKEKVFL